MPLQKGAFLAHGRVITEEGDEKVCPLAHPERQPLLQPGDVPGFDRLVAAGRHKRLAIGTKHDTQNTARVTGEGG